MGSGEVRGCTALIQSTPTGLETWGGRSTSFSSSALRGKKPACKNRPVFQDLEISGTQKARVQPVSSAFSFLKSILHSKRYFKTSLFKHLLHYKEGKGVKDSFFGAVFNCITNLCRPQGAEGSQDAHKYPSCHFITCKGWGPKN